MVVVETEIWPNLFSTCRAFDIPLVMVNARVRPRDVRRYRLPRPFFSQVLNCARWIGAQSSAEKERFMAIGAASQHVVACGSMKRHVAVGGQGAAVAARVPLPPATLVAGSTHAGEERMLLDVLESLHNDDRPARLVLAPRHLSRVPELLELASHRGFRTRRWSHGLTPDWEVLVVDTHGDLSRFYAGASLVVLGGTFSPVGGHNLFEAAVFGAPVIVGPSVETIEDVVTEFEEQDAVVRVPASSAAVTAACRSLLDNPEHARHMGLRASNVCRSCVDGVAAYANVITEVLSGPVQNDRRHQQKTGGQRGTERRETEPGLGNVGQIEGRQHDGHSHTDRGSHDAVQQVSDLSA